MNAGDEIKARIRRRLGRDDAAAETLTEWEEAQSPEAKAKALVAARLRHPPNGIRPQRVALDRAGLEDLFRTMLDVAAADYHDLAHRDAAPQAVAAWLRRRNLPLHLRLSGEEEITALPWHNAPELELMRDDTALAAAQVAVTSAFAGIAETGTLALISGAGRPTGLNFLPQAHIVLLRRENLLATYEDMWAKLRRQAAGPGIMPRTVNLITGPSRTGDIDQTIELGAHGPQRLLVMLLRAG